MIIDQILQLDTSILHDGYVLPAVALLVACLLFLPLLERIDVSPVLGYLMAGLLIGPSGLDMLDHSKALENLADLGVVFLLFIVGLNLSLAHFRSIRAMIFRIGLPQVLVTGGIIGLVAWQWDHTLAVTILLGLGFALSSTAIVSQYLLQKGILKTEKGRLIMAILLAQDLAVPALLVMANVFGQPTAHDWAPLATAIVVKAIIAVALVLGVARYAIRPLHSVLHKRSRTPEITVGLTFLAVLVSATLTSMAGLSMELGAFLAGLMLADSGFEQRIHADIRPFQGILLGLFFITVGMQIDLGEVITHLGWLVASVAGLFILKSGLITAICRMGGISWRQGLPAGILLAQGSEFVFVIIGTSLASGIMPYVIGQFMLLVTAFSMVLTPLYILLAEWLEKRLKVPEAL